MKKSTIIILTIGAAFALIVGSSLLSEEKTESKNVFEVFLGEEIPRSGGYCLRGIAMKGESGPVIDVDISPCWASTNIYSSDPRFLQTSPLPEGAARGYVVRRGITSIMPEGTEILLISGDSKKAVFKVSEPVNGIIPLS